MSDKSLRHTYHPCVRSRTPCIDRVISGFPYHFSFINCDFTRSGQSITASEIDFEDGWEACQDVFILNCKELEPAGSGDIITQTGLNHVYENNENLRFSIGYRVHGLCLRHNKGDSYGQSIGFMTKNTLRVCNNEFTGISGNVLSDYDAERLKALEESNDGFYISEQDFKLRGGGDIFGIRQSGEQSFKIANLNRDYKILMQCKSDAEEFLKSKNLDDYKVQKEILENLTIA